MSNFDDVLGESYLPPSPAYPIDQLVRPMGDAAALPSSPPPAADAPSASASPDAWSKGFTPRQVLGLLNSGQGGGFNVPTFMAGLGAGLSSAGQNWNKPAAAAFASGAGAAIQGGQQAANAQQDAKLKALQAAIAAWKVGDIAAYHQAITQLRAMPAQPRAPAASAPAAGAVPAPSPAPAPNNPNGAAVQGSSKGLAGTAASDVLAQARDAIARGASPEAVAQRLSDNGFGSLIG